MNEEQRNEVKANNSIPKAANAFFDIFESFLKAIIIVFIVLTFFFKICTVSGSSMNNTLFDSEKLIVSEFAYSPKEGDVIVFHQIGDILKEPVVKRVIATGGKYVKIDYDAQKLYVSDDENFDENDLVDESEYIYLDKGYYKQEGVYATYVPDGYLFVMGDNRNNSTDSRYREVGLVDERRVFGKVIFRFSPLNKAGTVK